MSHYIIVQVQLQTWIHRQLNPLFYHYYYHYLLCFAFYSWEHRLKSAVFANQSRNKVFVPPRHIRPLPIPSMSPRNFKLPSGDIAHTHIKPRLSNVRVVSKSFTPSLLLVLFYLVMVGKLVCPFDREAILLRTQSRGGLTMIFWV